MQTCSLAQIVATALLNDPRSFDSYHFIQIMCTAHGTAALRWGMR